MLEDVTAGGATIASSPVTVLWSSQFDLRSAASGRDYRIFVFEPPTPPPPAGYPVLTVLDGNLTFPIAAAMAATYAISDCPAVVVGVGYPTGDPLAMTLSRLRDLTPETPLEAVPQRPGGPVLGPGSVGGAEAFHRFLTEEVRPLIAADRRVDPDRETLFGYSLAGLYALHVLFNHPDAYRSYAAASPSIWWNEGAVLSRERCFSRQVQQGEIAPRVLISVGAREQTLPPRLPNGATAEDTAAQLAQARMVDNAWELGSRLEKLRGACGYRATFHAFDDEDHLTCPAAAVGRALDFATRD